MRITRYINGKKLTNPYESKYTIENEMVTSTIEKVNRRLNSSFDKNGDRLK